MQAPTLAVDVGDRPDTDIAGAAALGMRTELVRTGRFLPGTPLPDDLPLPDWGVESLRQLLPNDLKDNPRTTHYKARPPGHPL